jgi:hypothetical protein
MLKRFPLLLTAKTLITLILFASVVRYMVFPIASKAWENMLDLRGYYSGANKEIKLRLEKEHAELLEMESKLLPRTDPGKKSAAYYDFMQETFKKHAIQAIKINSGEQITMQNVKRESYSIIFSSTYPIVGRIVHDLENGPFYCAIKSIHLLSKSLIGNTIEVEMSLTFSRMER